MYDPKQLFVVNAVSREGICEDIADFLEFLQSEGELVGESKPLVTDPRLDDEFCQGFAGAMGDLDDGLGEEAHAEQYHCFIEDQVRKFFSRSFVDAL